MGVSLLPVGSLAKRCETAQIKISDERGRGEEGGGGRGDRNVTSMMYATTYFCRLVLRL